MAERCTICQHPERALIEEALYARRIPLRDLGQTYGVSRSALSRHRLRHMTPDEQRLWWPGPGQRKREATRFAACTTADTENGLTRAEVELYVLEHREVFSDVSVAFPCPVCGHSGAAYSFGSGVWMCNACASGGGWRDLARRLKR